MQNKLYTAICIGLAVFSQVNLSAQYEGGSGRGFVSQTISSRIIDGTTPTATSILFTVSPENTVNPNTFSASVMVFSSNNLRLNTNTSISIAIGTNPGSGTLSGTTTVNASAGLAQFSGLSINNSGTGYTLTASAAGLSSVSSSAFSVFDNLYSGGSGDGHHSQEINEKVVGGQKLWRGANSTDWGTAANWYPSGVPGSSDAISIENNTYSNNPILDADRAIASIDFSGASKKIEVGAFTLTVSERIFNTDANHYVKTASTGLLKSSISNSSTFAFPVGNSAYNPVSITNNTGSSDAFSVRVVDAVYENGISGTTSSNARVDRTWYIEKNNPTANAGSGVNFMFNWNSGETVGSVVSPKLQHHDGTSWQQQSGSTTVSGNSLTYSGYKGTFSPFAIMNDLIVLPITWLDFQCAYNDNSVQLQWSTAMEQNSRRFWVERSAEGKNYQSIAEIPAAGYSNTIRKYTFHDAQPLPQGAYYRIKMEDASGNFSYSEYCVSKSASEYRPAQLKLYPNPAGQQLYMAAVEPERNFEWEVFSVSGKRVAAGISKDGKAVVRLQSLSEGVYHVKVTGSGLSENHRVVIKR